MDLFSATLGLAGGSLATYGLSRLREHRAEPKSLSDLVGWAFMVEPGTVQLKDGALMRGWRFRGPDLSTCTSLEIDALSRQINAALKPLGTGWMINVDAVRLPTVSYAPRAQTHFEQAPLRFLDETRRASFENRQRNYQTEHVLCLTYLPPKALYRKIGEAFIEGRDSSTNEWDMILGQFRDECDAVIRRLNAKLHVEGLGTDQLLRHLHGCMTGKWHPVKMPPDNPYLMSLLATEHLVGGFEPEIGDLHIRPVSVHGFPFATEPAQMDFMNNLRFPCRWSTRFMPYSREAASKKMSQMHKSWRRKGQGGSGMTQGEEEEDAAKDLDALNMTDDIDEARSLTTSGEATFGLYTSTVIVMEEDADRADHVAKELVSTLGNAGFPATVENVNALNAYLGSLPGHGEYNNRRPLISTQNVADLLPVTSIWPGRAENPSDLIPNQPALMWTRSDGATPFRVNLHHGDVGHAFCIGKTGAGKSVLVGTLASQWLRYRNAQLYIFDVGYSHYLLHMLAGGQHYDLMSGRDTDVNMQPLRHVDKEKERIKAMKWLDVCFELQGYSLSPRERQTLTEAVRLVGSENAPDERTLTQLMVNLADSADLQAVIQQYTAGGEYGKLLDASKDGVDDGRCQIFEIKHLIDNGDKIVIPVLTYLFDRIEKQLSTNRPTLIIIEEAWAALMKSIFADRLKRWLLTLRKENAAVFMVAHSPTQFKDDRIRNVEMLVENCKTRLFLPNPDATDTKEVYKTFGLNEREIDRIADAEEKREYYFSSPDGARKFRLGLSKEELAFMGSAPGFDMTETMDLAQRLYAEHGPRWPAAWLRKFDLPDAAERFERQLENEGDPQQALSGLIGDGAGERAANVPDASLSRS